MQATNAGKSTEKIHAALSAADPQVAPAASSHEVRSRPPSPVKTGSPPGAISMPKVAPADAGAPPTLLSQAYAAKGLKYNDSHMHPKDYRQRGLALMNYIGEMDKLGIQYTTLMPIPTSVMPIGRELTLAETMGVCNCDPGYYLTSAMKSLDFISKSDIRAHARTTQLYFDSEVDARTASFYNRLGEKQKQRLDPMITGLHLGADDCANKLLEKLEMYPNVFTGVGEITIHKEVVDKLLCNTWAHIHKNNVPLIQLLHTCGKIGMPVVVHCDVGRHYEAERKGSKYVDGVKMLFSHEMVKATTVIWAHAGGLGRFVNAPSAHVSTLREMLQDASFANLHIDLSWTVVADKLVNEPRVLEQWRTLIDDFPDRFIFGSDTLAPLESDQWDATYKKYAELRSRLRESTERKVFVENYQRIFVQARAKVRDYEKTRLAEDLNALNPVPLAGIFVQSTADATTASTSATSASSGDSISAGVPQPEPAGT